MSYPSKILFQLFVKPFFKENAGAFVFLLVVMFCIIGKVDGAGVFEYHYSLITGMLKSNGFLSVVFFAWFVYVRKFTGFVANGLQEPQNTFIHIFKCLSRAKQFGLFLAVDTWLLLPVLIYTSFIIVIGFRLHYYFSVLLVIVYLLLLCMASAAWHVYQLHNLQKQAYSKRQFNVFAGLSSSYPFMLIRFVFNSQKLIWIGVKVFTCGLLYLDARNNTAADYDTSFPFLFFNFGILANGIVIHRIREFEERRLAFYRGAPVLLIRRLLEYSLVYFALLLPEFITTTMLAPVHLLYIDALRFSLCAFSLLLLLNSITFLQSFGMKEYLKILLLIFCVQYVLFITIGLTVLYLLFFALAIVFFFRGYYTFDVSINGEQAIKA